MGGSEFAEFLWSAPQFRQDCLVFRAHTGLEICSVNFEQLVVLVMAAPSHPGSHAALVGEGRVGQEGGDSSPGLFALKVGQ